MQTEQIQILNKVNPSPIEVQTAIDECEKQMSIFIKNGNTEKVNKLNILIGDLIDLYCIVSNKPLIH